MPIYWIIRSDARIEYADAERERRGDYAALARAYEQSVSSGMTLRNMLGYLQLLDANQNLKAWARDELDRRADDGER